MSTFAAAARESFAPLAEKVLPSVVGISARLTEAQDQPYVLDNLLFRSSDGHSALGAGFVVSPDGYVATNRHVIEQSTDIRVTLNDGTAYTATVAGIDPKTDFALLKIEPENLLTAVVFGDSEQLRVGDWVLAVGNPFGLTNSVSAGIVSAKERDIGDGTYDDYIQTDAAINQGNSGGPLFDMQGELVGMNTAIFSDKGTGIGVGFALPVEQAVWVIEQLRQKGKVERSSIGVLLKNTTTPNGRKGLVVTALAPEYNADVIGLQVGDVILEADHVVPDSARRFSARLARVPVGTDVILKILRNGQEDELMVKTLLRPEKTAESPDVSQESKTLSEGAKSLSYGMEVNRLKIVSVAHGSQAETKGIKVGDEIIGVAGKAATDDKDLSYYIKDAQNTTTSLRLDLKDANGEVYFVEFRNDGGEDNDAD